MQPGADGHKSVIKGLFRVEESVAANLLLQSGRSADNQRLLKNWAVIRYLLHLLTKTLRCNGWTSRIKKLFLHMLSSGQTCFSAGSGPWCAATRRTTATRSRRWKAVNVPSFALKCLQKLGMPEPMIFACQHVWGQQIRYLQYRGGCISATPSHVSNSLPQGDALSVIALLAILSMPTLDLRRQAAQDGEHVNMITFVDDRSFLTQNAVHAMTMINRWMQWSVDLGLVENDHKMCVVARTTSVKATMLAYGAQEKRFAPTARILRQPGDVVFCQHAAVGFFANCHKQMQEILALACQPCTHCTIGRPFHTSKNAIDP